MRVRCGYLTVEKFRNGSVESAIGDEALYGRNYIIEPIYETPNPGYMGNRASTTNVHLSGPPHQVATWPVIRFIFMLITLYGALPGTGVTTPVSWRPWRPYYWHYYGYHYNWYHDYYVQYRFWSRPRYTNYNTYYINIRTQSPECIQE